MDLSTTDIFMLPTMLFSHVVDDYYLQGILASMKNKSWWKENAPNDLYKKDYLMALFMHSFSWSFSIMLAPAVYLLCNDNFHILYFIIYAVNTLVHFIIDNAKANLHTICLIEDQIIHIVQIIITWAILFCI